MKLDKLVLNAAAVIAKILPTSVKRSIYQNPTLSKSIRGRLNRFAPQGLSEVVIAAGANEHMKMRLDLHREKDYWLGTYEVELQLAIEKFVRPGQIIYDIGANIGFITLLFARNTGPKGHVYAFEALPENTRRLEQNIELNGFQERVSVIPAAVLDHSGEVEFLVGPSTSMGKVQGSAGRKLSEGHETIQVEGVSVDGFIDSGKPVPDIVKMDIEGGEVLALSGMERTLRENRSLLMVELHGIESAQACWEVLQAANYSIHHMTNRYPLVNCLEDLGWKSYLVAIPDEY